MILMSLLMGCAAGFLVMWGFLALRGWLWRRRQQQRMLLDLRSLNLPLMMIEFPGDKIHFSPVLRQDLGIESVTPMTLEQALSDHVEERDHDRIGELVRDIKSGKHVYREAEFKVRYADGRWHEVEIQAFRLGTCGLRAGVLAATLVDRTQSRVIEEERDRLFNLSIDLLAVGDMGGYMQQVNPAWVRVLRWSRDDIMAQSFIDLLHEDDRDRGRQAQAELEQGMPVRDLELRTMCRDGSHRWLSWSSFPLLERRTVFTVARDITDRKADEKQLQRYQLRLQQLASQLATVEERENRRLAEILHDTLAQDIFAAQAKLSLLKYPEKLENPEEVLQGAADILAHTSELTRSLTFELFPPALYEVGLDAALEWLCRSIRKTRGLECAFSLKGEPIDLPQDMRTLMFQGARELLGNVFKHAKATVAEVSLMYEEDSIVVRVDDDGCGFDLPSLAGDDDVDQTPGGFGLFNIRERVGQLSGDLSIESSPHGGSRVTITLPHQHDEDIQE